MDSGVHALARFGNERADIAPPNIDFYRDATLPIFPRDLGWTLFVRHLGQLRERHLFPRRR